MLYYKGLIEMRKAFGIFTDLDAEVSYKELGSGIAAITIDDGKGGKALIVINPHAQALPFELEGEWTLVADGTRAGAAALSQDSGLVTVDGISVRIYVNDGAK